MARGKVTDQQIIAVLLDESVNASDIARRCGVTSTAVAAYKRRAITRANVIGSWMVSQGLKPVWWPAETKATMFSPQTIRAIRATKGPSSRIAKVFGCSPAMIRMIRLRKSYAEVGD
jgi:hypothetical protein